MDDKFEPPLAKANAKVLIEEKNVLALFLNRGTPHSEGIIPLLEANGWLWWRRPPARWCCTSRCARTCSTCAPPTSARPRRP